MDLLGHFPYHPEASPDLCCFHRLVLGDADDPIDVIVGRKQGENFFDQTCFTRPFYPLAGKVGRELKLRARAHVDHIVEPVIDHTMVFDEGIGNAMQNEEFDLNDSTRMKLLLLGAMVRHWSA